MKLIHDEIIVINDDNNNNKKETDSLQIQMKPRSIRTFIVNQQIHQS